MIIHEPKNNEVPTEVVTEPNTVQVTEVSKIPEKQVSNRNEEGKFIKGFSGNPKGRPKKGQTLTDTMRDYLEAEDSARKQRFIEKVYELAEAGDPTALKLVWNYIDGMPGGSNGTAKIQLNQQFNSNIIQEQKDKYGV